MGPVTKEKGAAVLDKWTKILGVLLPFAAMPAGAWAINVQSELAALRTAQQVQQAERRAAETIANDVREDVKGVRSALEAMRTEVVQRLTRLEASVEKR